MSRIIFNDLVNNGKVHKENTSFSFIFRLGNEYIYPILNWKEPSKVIITATGIYIFLLALAIGLMLIDKLKSVIHRITMPKTQ